jgi:hypothetical protein
MKIQTFTSAEEANAFVDTVKVKDIQYYDGEIVVFYNTYLSVSEVRDMKILEDENDALVALTQAEMHLEYLEEVKRSTPEEGLADVGTGIENTKQNIINQKAKLATVAKWKLS